MAAAVHGRPVGSVDKLRSCIVRWFTAVLAWLALLIFGAPAPASSPATFGAYVQPDGVKSASVFEAQVPMGIDQTFVPKSAQSIGALPSWDVSHHITPLITFGSGIPSTQVSSGQYDAYFAKLADQIHALGAPVLLRYDHEMDGKANASWVGTPAQFVAAWRHVWTLFREHRVFGAWVWEPNASAFPAKAATYWPGGRYVDWVGADGYNWGSCRGSTSPWRSFAQIFHNFYVWGARTGKPLVVTEFGTVEGAAGAKAAWFSQIPQELRAMPQIRAVVYFDAVDTTHGRTCDWQPQSSPSSWHGFVTMAKALRS